MSAADSKTMQAVGWPAGKKDPEPLQVEVPAVGADQVMVHITWSAANPADFKISEGALVGRVLHARTVPLVLGFDFAGTVEACGPGVTDLKPGDEVFGHLAYAGSTRQGAYAERVAVDRGSVGRRPASVSPEVAAAAATAGLTALQSMRNLGKLSAGGKVLIVGAAGGVGTLAVGVGKRLGAHVTAVCSTYAVDYVKGLGADEVVDRRKQDPLKLPGPFDVVFDAASAYSYLACSHLLTSSGTYVRTLPDLGVGLGKLATLFSSRRCEFIMVQSRAAELEQLATWIGEGMQVPIDSRFPVRDLSKALARLKSGELRGRVAVQVEGGF